MYVYSKKKERDREKKMSSHITLYLNSQSSYQLDKIKQKEPEIAVSQLFADALNKKYNKLYSITPEEIQQGYKDVKELKDYWDSKQAEYDKIQLELKNKEKEEEERKEKEIKHKKEKFERTKALIESELDREATDQEVQEYLEGIESKLYNSVFEYTEKIKALDKVFYPGEVENEIPQ